MSAAEPDPPSPCDPDPLAARLARLDRDQLIALVHRLVNHAPAGEELVMLPLPGEREPVDGAVITRQVNLILGSMRFEWRAAGLACRELEPIVALGEGYLKDGATSDAQVVFIAIIGAILGRYHHIWDEESQIAGIAIECIEGLGRCLEGSADPLEREALLRELFGVYRWDSLDHGGYGLGRPVERALLTHATPDERRQIASWVRGALPQISREHSRWGRQEGGRLVLALLGSDLELAELDAIYTEASLDGPRLELLLGQGRTEEALALVRGADRADLLGLANRLVAAGMAAEAEASVRDSDLLLDWVSSSAREWLRQRGADLPANADELARAVWTFQRNPTSAGYERLRSEARAASRWPGVLAQLGELHGSAKKLQSFQARIRAELGDAEGALAALDGLEGGAWRPTAAAVAASLEASHPAESARLYRRVIDALLAHGTKPARILAAELRARLTSLEVSDQ